MTGWEVLTWLADQAGTSVSTILYSCRSFDPWLILATITSDLLLCFAYFNIGGAAVVFIFHGLHHGLHFPEIRLRIAESVSPALALMWGLFIIFCGMVHGVHAWTTLYGPDATAEAMLRVPTALVSVVTAIWVDCIIISRWRKYWGRS